MNRITRCLILIALLCLFPEFISALGNITVSPSSLIVEVGKSKEFKIDATNVIGDVSIFSSNPEIASVSTPEWTTGVVDEGEFKNGYINVIGKSVGNAIITLKLDAATFDSEDLSGQVRTINVSVIEKKANIFETFNTIALDDIIPFSIIRNKSIKDGTQSNNNSLKDISIDGYSPKKIDNNNYTFEVSNDVSSINIDAVLEDNKAKITGCGEHNLNIGENFIKLIVISESGKENVINIKVTRKGAFYLEEIDKALTFGSNNISIRINSDSILSSLDLDKIKRSKKKVKLDYYNDNQKLIYSWLLDGNKIKNFKFFNTSISLKSLKNNSISNGLYVNVKNDYAIPNGTRLKLFVGNKYKNSDSLNIYYYNKNSNRLEIMKDDLIVKNGYVDFEVLEKSSYILTDSKIQSANDTSIFSSNPLFVALLIILLIVIIVIICIFLYFLKKNKNGMINCNYSKL